MVCTLLAYVFVIDTRIAWLPARNPHEDHKRSVHIAAEQKRRNNINTGFEELQQLIPACSSPARTTRISKANVLRKAIDYICYLVREKTGLVEELTRMRREVVALRMLVSQYRSTGSINEDHMEAVMRMSDADGQAAQSADPGKPVENPETAKFFIVRLLNACVFFVCLIFLLPCSFVALSWTACTRAFRKRCLWRAPRRSRAPYWCGLTSAAVHRR